MKAGEWSRSRFWLCYFLHNRHVRARVEPSQGDASDSPLLDALARVANTQVAVAGANRRTAERAARKCADDPAYVQSLRLFVKEQQYHAALLREAAPSRDRTSLTWRIAHALTDGLRQLLTLRFELAVLMLNQIVLLTLARVIASATSDATLRAIAEQIARDTRGHVAFHGERLTTEFADFNFVRRNLRRFRLRVMCAVALVLAAVQYRRLLRAAGTHGAGPFIRMGWATFSDLLERMVPYRRDTLLRRLLQLREHPYDKPTLGGM